MFPQRSRVLVGTLCAIVVTIVMLGVALPGAAQTPDTAAVIGTWNVTFSPGTPDEEFGMALINQGGTASFVGADLERAEGAWIKTAPRTFSMTLHQFEADGDRFQIRTTIQMVDRNHFTATITSDHVSPDGTVVLEAGNESGSFAGTRMPVVPE